MGLAEGAQPLLDQGRVGQHPAVQGGVVHLQTALQKQLLDVAIAERVAQVPRDGLQDQRCLEVPALEIVLRPALQLLDKGVQEHRPPPGWRWQSRPTCLTDHERQTLRHARFYTGSGRWTRIEDSWVVEHRVGWCTMRRGGEPWRG